MRASPPSALLISPSEEDHDFLHALFNEEGWTLHSAFSVASASAILRNIVVSVVITAAELPVGTWRDVLCVMGVLANRPIVIVTSSQADDRLWAEALNLGAYDVIATRSRSCRKFSVESESGAQGRRCADLETWQHQNQNEWKAAR